MWIRHNGRALRCGALRQAAGERGAPASLDRCVHDLPAPGMAADHARRLCLCAVGPGINIGLLVFNILPIYPLDGGQILRSLLWFPLGRARSLMVATVLGFAGVAGFIGLAVFSHSFWFGAIAVFILLNCWRGVRQVQAAPR